MNNENQLYIRTAYIRNIKEKEQKYSKKPNAIERRKSKLIMICSLDEI